MKHGIIVIGIGKTRIDGNASAGDEGFIEVILIEISDGAASGEASCSFAIFAAYNEQFDRRGSQQISDLERSCKHSNIAMHYRLGNEKCG